MKEAILLTSSANISTTKVMQMDIEYSVLSRCIRDNYDTDYREMLSLYFDIYGGSLSSHHSHMESKYYGVKFIDWELFLTTLHKVHLLSICD